MYDYPCDNKQQLVKMYTRMRVYVCVCVCVCIQLVKMQAVWLTPLYDARFANDSRSLLAIYQVSFATYLDSFDTGNAGSLANPSLRRAI